MAKEVSAVAGVISAAVAVGSAIGEIAPTHRQCTVEIKNECTDFILCNPRVFFESGGCGVPLSPWVSSSSSSLAQFAKTPNTACGSVGVFTYDLLNKTTKATTEKMAVMFSVPYDFIEYSNLYAVGVFNSGTECDLDLYNEMYYKSNSSFIRGKACDPYLTYEGNQVTIMAAMSDCYQPVIKVQVNIKGNE
ncbi:DELTA-sagatoxin-Srs1a-like [Genypterus blacodes]|uniref:DELTA-sagatoxin-Srs1a-like n=1 Tax=Genypterus blacodes TaxID=154954 RepID=UPI003F7586A1